MGDARDGSGVRGRDAPGQSTGQCTDEATRKFVGDLVRAFEGWIAQVKRSRG
ncbi:MAG TPA: hypothetical protein VLE94_00065 [Burkholderiaceae bacterium]|nr:hypothetical protein [Burkholderiaceae bacterium]